VNSGVFCAIVAGKIRAGELAGRGGAAALDPAGEVRASPSIKAMVES
jgi:hypothetical protein